MQDSGCRVQVCIRQHKAQRFAVKKIRDLGVGFRVQGLRFKV